MFDSVSFAQMNMISRTKGQDNPFRFFIVNLCDLPARCPEICRDTWCAMAMAIPNGNSGDAASSKARWMPNDDFEADMMPDMHLSYSKKQQTNKQTQKQSE